MDPLRGAGSSGPRERSFEPHDYEPRRVRARTEQPRGGTVPLSPRRAMSGDIEAGPSLAPRGAGPARPMLLDLNASPPGSPRPALPDPNASPPGSPRPDLLELPELPEGMLAAFGVHGEPQPAHVFLLVDQVAQHAGLERNILRATGDLLVELVELSELRDGLESRYPHADPATNRVIAQLLAQLDEFDANNVDSDLEIDGLENDLDRQQHPLGHEIQAWLRGTVARAGSAHAFDGEDNAASFARMLARLREPTQPGTSAAPAQIAAQVLTVIQAIASDAGLRAKVFSLAETALGSCTDNLAEGFSKVLLAVDQHQMAQAVETGEVNAAQLNRWAGQRFRLSLLETAVHRFIHDQLQRPDLPNRNRNALTAEPLETMLHAKVALRKHLDLPDGTASTMQFDGCSVLGQQELRLLVQAVVGQAADRAVHGSFLLGDPTWRAGMKAAHAPAFQKLQRERDEDPFYDLDVPADSSGEGAFRYAEVAEKFRAKWAQREDELLLSLRFPN